MVRERLTGLAALPRLPAALLLVGMLATSWAVVFIAGGTRTAMPHLFYLPVIVAVIPFGRRGGMTTGVAATVLCGPLMPLDVMAGVAQPPGNWLVRGLFFVIVGGLAGTAARTAASGIEHRLTTRLADELQPAGQSDHGSPDPGVVRDVVDGRRFTMVFQPIYDLDGGELLAIEALARFPDIEPAQSPASWFAQAAEVGLGLDLELATAEAALEAMAHLPGRVALALNMSPACVTDPRLGRLLEPHTGRDVIVELTEHAIVDDYGGLRAALDQLRARGARVAVDDAGAGFASLQHIVRLAPDIIKLDISLTQHVRDDPVRRALAGALVQFAQQTGTLLIAEGIETPADLATWQDLGAHAAQGYLLAHPAPPPITLTACPALAGRTAGRHTLVELVDVGH